MKKAKYAALTAVFSAVLAVSALPAFGDHKGPEHSGHHKGWEKKHYGWKNKIDSDNHGYADQGPKDARSRGTRPEQHESRVGKSHTSLPGDENITDVRNARKNVRESRQQSRRDVQDLKNDRAELRKDLRTRASRKEVLRDRQAIRSSMKKVAESKKELKQSRSALEEARRDLQKDLGGK